MTANLADLLSRASAARPDTVALVGARTASDGVEATLQPGDAFFVPSGVPHRYGASDAEVAEAVFGVAPSYEAPD